MSFFLVFLAIVLVGAVLWASVGRRGGGAGGRFPALLDRGFEQPPANLPPVLLPAQASPQDVDRIRFSVGLRGYRMDQVDQVLDELKEQLAAKHKEAEELRSRLQAAERGAAPEGFQTDDQPGEGSTGADPAPGKDAG